MLRNSKLMTTSESESSNLVTLPASVKTAYSSVLQVLIDSGTTLNFINEWIVTQLKLKTEPCPSTHVTLADRRLLARLAHQVTLEYPVAGVAQCDIFLIAPIGDHSLILGMPWLERVNPRINWRVKSVDTNDFFHSSTSSASSAPEVPDLAEAEEHPLVSGIELPHEHEDSYPHISSNLASKESTESKESNFCSLPPIGSSNPPSPKSKPASPSMATVSKVPSPPPASPVSSTLRISKGPPASAASPIPKASPNPRIRWSRSKSRRSRSNSGQSAANLLPNFSHDRPFIDMMTRIYPSDQVFLAIYHFDSHSLSMMDVTLEEPDSEASAEVSLDDIPPEYRDVAAVFSKANADKLPPHRGHLDHSIPLEPGSKPHSRPTYSLSEVELDVLREYFDMNLAKGFIQESSSPYGAPVLFVKKSHSRGLRLCVDYRVLNRSTVKNNYPLPLISELLDHLKHALRYTKIDLQAAYNFLPIALDEEWKTAFRTRYGHFEYLVMPFGLTNAPATFQSYINSALREYLNDFCVAYLDDILIYSKSMEEHVKHVRKVLEKLLEHGLYASLKKC
jgi:hypothetical protein